jgi:hypothetical protein
MQIIDVAIGLVFVYLMLSLVCTAANELLSQWFNSRATTLKQGIDTLLRDAVAPIDVAAELQVAEQAEAARDALEAMLRKDATALFERWQTARRRVDDARFALDELCSLARGSVAGGSLTSGSAAIGTPPLWALDLAQPTSVLGAAQTTFDRATETLTGVSNELEQWRAGTMARLTTLRSEAAEARANHTLATFYAHPLIVGLSQLPWRLWPWDTKVRIPSYIPTHTFTRALLDTIAPASSGAPSPLLEVRRALATLPEHVRRPLLLALNDAAGDVNAFRAGVATWFDNAMERVSGLYKRKTKITVLLLAIGVTLFTNADTLRIVRALSSNQALRDALVAQAQATVRAPEAIKSQFARDTGASADARRASFAKSLADMQALGIPIGYVVPDSTSERIEAASWVGAPWKGTLYLRLYVPQILSGLIGLLLTALALSLGAPFWFDMLNKVVNVRAVGRTPAENAKIAQAQSTAPPATK